MLCSLFLRENISEREVIYMAYPQYYPQYPQYQYQNYQTPMFNSNPQPQQQNNSQINWVNGEAGAKSWVVGRGETVLLMDADNSTFYIKSIDNAGMPLPLRVFDYKERIGQPQSNNSSTSEQFVTREEYNALSGKYEELKASIEEIKKNKSVKKKEGGDNE